MADQLTLFRLDKRCSRCSAVKALSEFNRHRSGKPKAECRACSAARCRAYYRRHRDISYERKLRQRYGIGIDDYRAMLEFQGGHCATCPSTDPGKTHGRQRRYFNVDHDHETGLVRGLLCDKCNVALGMALDDVATLQRMVEYLEAAREVAGCGA